MTTQNTRLDGWKAIAAHVGRSERTVHRWARERGLPVHHLSGVGSVFAWSAELDAWFVRQSQASSPEPAEAGSSPGPEPATDARGPAPQDDVPDAPPLPASGAAGITPRRVAGLACVLLALVGLAGWWVLGETPIEGAQRGSAGPVVTAEEALRYAGQVATVCGRVVAANYAKSTKGSPTFLNFSKAYPNQPFMVVIWGTHRAKFQSPELAYLQKRVCVLGRVEIYQGVAEIVVTTPAAMRVTP